LEAGAKLASHIFRLMMGGSRVYSAPASTAGKLWDAWKPENRGAKQGTFFPNGINLS